MSLKTQAKVLRVLEEQAFERVGGKETLRVDVRVLAASNQNLQEQIAPEPLPRGPLLPPRRHPHRGAAAAPAHRKTCPLLVEHFIRLFSGENAKRPKTMSVEALAYFLSYDWPGNVRELRNMVERLVIMTPGDVIGPEALPPPLRPRDAEPPAPTTASGRRRSRRRARPSSARTS